MSRQPPRNDRGYQPLQAGSPSLPPRPNSGPGLFDRRMDRPPPPPPQERDYRQSSPGYDQRGMERRPVPQQSSSPGFFSKLTRRGGYESPRQQGGIFRVAKVSVGLINQG